MQFATVDNHIYGIPRVAHATNRSIDRLPGIAALLGCPVEFKANCDPTDMVLAWGRKPSAVKAEKYAARHGLPVVYLEDGFLRSVNLGNQDPPLSLVVDDLGIYYDATCPSRLESQVKRQLDIDEQTRSTAVINAWPTGRVSKYNHARELHRSTLPERYVLAVDQTRGDASIRFGQASESSFTQMLEAALDENPDSTIVLKIHPDVFAGRKQGNFGRLTLGQASRVVVLGRDVHPASLLEHAESIYTVTSQMGFEGLLWRKPVHTFGMPFYAGWGLTKDVLPPPERRTIVPLESLVHAALIEYPRYIDPETGERCQVERVLEHLALQRRMRERFPETIHAVGFSRWKKPIVRSFFQGSSVRFVRSADTVPSGATLAVWGRKLDTIPGCSRTQGRNIQVIRLEDGFLRSVGLGAELVRPLSWVMDRSGMYYDATTPSDLESLLQNTNFDEGLIDRAARLRQALCDSGISKYNVGRKHWQRPTTEQRVILVPGQVESDASIRFGAAGIKGNMELLQAVRRANPDAYLVYKPHPDVHAGVRRSGVDEASAALWCNEVVVDVPIQELLEVVDEIQVMTSLAGFEALLRGRRVVTYGMPFYAGWGLTEDMLQCQRRTRTLTLEELVAGALLLYPAYVSRVTGRFTTPERALMELLAWREEGVTTRPLWRRLFRWLVHWGGRN
jgi:capsular polysaccharide export protein